MLPIISRGLFSQLRGEQNYCLVFHFIQNIINHETETRFSQNNQKLVNVLPFHPIRMLVEHWSHWKARTHIPNSVPLEV
jgi:hypothetical protein